MIMWHTESLLDMDRSSKSGWSPHLLCMYLPTKSIDAPDSGRHPLKPSQICHTVALPGDESVQSAWDHGESLNDPLLDQVPWTSDHWGWRMTPLQRGFTLQMFEFRIQHFRWVLPRCFRQPIVLEPLMPCAESAFWLLTLVSETSQDAVATQCSHT